MKQIISTKQKPDTMGVEYPAPQKGQKQHHEHSTVRRNEGEYRTTLKNAWRLWPEYLHSDQHRKDFARHFNQKFPHSIPDNLLYDSHLNLSIGTYKISWVHRKRSTVTIIWISLKIPSSFPFYFILRCTRSFADLFHFHSPLSCTINIMNNQYPESKNKSLGGKKVYI